MTERQIEETFQGINKFWKEKHYVTCLFEWEEVQQFITEEKTDYQCGNCNTYWTKITHINDYYNICPKCDTWDNPFLCNPINRQFVLKYIDKKWHYYIFHC